MRDFIPQPFMGKIHGRAFTTVTFQVPYPDGYVSPYIPLASVLEPPFPSGTISGCLQYLEDPDEIVFPESDAIIIADYPLNGRWQFPVTSKKPEGFSRQELAKIVSEIYHHIYAAEELSSNTPVIPMEERLKGGGLINRNATDGCYGVWGHDIGDLVLASIDFYRNSDGKPSFATLGIDS